MPDKILVVDDEVEIADLIEVYLNNENYSVFKFYSAKEALDCINTTNLDLAILDVMLPDIDGYTLCQKIRTRHTYPIIMLTAKDGETDRAREFPSMNRKPWPVSCSRKFKPFRERGRATGVCRVEGSAGRQRNRTGIIHKAGTSATMLPPYTIVYFWALL